jgi:hypothetical protein
MRVKREDTLCKSFIKHKNKIGPKILPVPYPTCNNEPLFQKVDWLIVLASLYGTYALM